MAKDLVAILFFCVVARTLATILFPNVFSTPAGELIGQSVMYLLLLGFSIAYLRLRRQELKNVIGGRPPQVAWAFAAVWIVAMLMLAFGESAVEAWSLAQFSPNTAYRLWNFHELPNNPYPPYSHQVLTYIAVTALLAPATEEFFFRGLLFPTLAIKRGVHQAATLSSLIFVVLHLAHPYILSTFLFSLSLCYVYLLSRSLWLCALIHMGYNILAFLHQYYFDIHWTRGVTQLDSWVYWQPQLVMLLVSCAIILIATYYFWERLRSAVAPSDWGTIFSSRSTGASPSVG